ncbi:MAG: carboxylating nicotinate-nucleotide diphosphorylase [bacterium]
MDNFVVYDLVRQALKEDIGHGDLTTNSFISSDKIIEAKFNSREEGVLAGLPVVKSIFKMLDENIEFTSILNDGDKIVKGQDIAVVKGKARAILTGERVALNFIQRMSAIATKTNQFQEAIKPYKAKISDTRKSCPNFRIFEKYSVKAGGGFPHRFGLYDAVMIKDNHIKAAGSIKEAVKTAKQNVPHTIKIEVETENFAQIIEAVDSGADIIMFDNMSVEEMKKGVEFVNGRSITEASGTINLETINLIASSGVDYISTSAITAKAGILDIGLDV